MEELEGGEGNADLALTGTDDPTGMQGMDTKTNAMCVINAQGTIQMVNKVVAVRWLGARTHLDTMAMAVNIRHCFQPAMRPSCMQLTAEKMPRC